MQYLENWKKELELKITNHQNSFCNESFLLPRLSSNIYCPTISFQTSFQNRKEFDEHIKEHTDLIANLSSELEILTNFDLEGTPSNKLILLLINKMFDHKEYLESEIQGCTENCLKF
jgi:hypothetical protein